MQGIVIAGTHSGCGKTTITLGLLAALKKRGRKAQSFKAGPDFIDSGLHRLITGRPSRNLDIWMCGRDYVRDCYTKYSRDADISVVEGVMGMYDGDFSTARLAGILNIPVILVVDAYGMAESAGAVVKGYKEFRSQNTEYRIQGPRFLGVIFNRVASESHYRRLKDSVNDIEVLGYLPRDLDFEIPHRHLGLTVAEENPLTRVNIERLADAVIRRIDMDMIVKSTNKTTVPSFPLVGNLSYADKEGLRTSRNNNKTKIAVAYDRAFCFYYEDNLDLLRDCGAEIVTFSPLTDTGVPADADAVYIGGGYPELYAEELSKNTSMLRSVTNWSDSGKPLYAECGGLMYLSQGIHDFNSNFFKMAGIFPFETEMKKGRSRLGYREIVLKEGCMLGKSGNTARGHEFHYSEIKKGSQFTAYSSQYAVKDNSGSNLQHEGYRFKNTLASYIHIHFGSNLSIAQNFAAFIKERQ